MKGTAHSSHHIIPIPVYTRTIVLLAILMVLTIAAAQVPYFMKGSPLANFLLETPIGSWTMNLVAMGIATIKAVLVVSIFMGFSQGTKLVKLWALAGFVWFSLFFIMYADYGTRRFEPSPSWLKEDKGSAMPRTIKVKEQESAAYEGPTRPRN
jgi:caa(3)-type oxidase subunit IV